MLWIGIGLSLVGVVVAMGILVTRHPAHADELGAVSDRWIAQHRVDTP